MTSPAFVVHLPQENDLSAGFSNRVGDGINQTEGSFSAGRHHHAEVIASDGRQEGASIEDPDGLPTCRPANAGCPPCTS